MSKLISTNPGKNYAVVGEVTVSTPNEIAKKVQAARVSQPAWRELGVSDRIKRLTPICQEFEERKNELAKLITEETGKPLQQTIREVRWYSECFRWFLDHVTESIQDEVTFEDEASLHRLTYEPLGVAAVITPWNFPYGMGVWGIVPNLLVGNTVVFKTSEECPLTGTFIEEVFNNHDLPQGVFAEVYGAGDVGQALSESAVDLIWFTGSTRTGKALYKTAAEQFIRVVLEMGGSNPCIVFEDADIEQAAQIVYANRFQNCGQVCNAIKRLIVHEAIKDKMVDALTKIIDTKQFGDPDNENTDLGALVAQRQVELLTGQVNDSLEQGATLLYQKKQPVDVEGAYYPPTLMGDVTNTMRVWSEEVFGPVLPIMTFNTEAEAIELANNTPYGLGSRVITADKARAERVARHIEAGTVEINSGDRWLLCNTFGGYKNSGIGREHGKLGFHELCQVKVISASK